MAQVPDYGGPQLSPAVGAGAQGASFQAMKAHEIDLVKPFEAVTNQFAGVQAKILQETNEARAAQADNALADDLDKLLLDPETGYLNLRGEAALKPDKDGVSPLDTMMKLAEDSVQTHTAGMSAEQSRLFKIKAGQRLNNLYARGAQHAMTENHNYLVSTWTENLNKSIKSAFLYPDSPDTLKRAMDNAKVAASKLAELQGTNRQGEIKKAIEGAHSATVVGLLLKATEDPSYYAVAAEYIKNHSKEMSPNSVVQYQGQARAGQKSYASDQVAAQVAADVTRKPETVQLVASSVAPDDPGAADKYAQYVVETGDPDTAVAMLATSPDAISAAKEAAKKAGNEAGWVAFLSSSDKAKVNSAMKNFKAAFDEGDVIDANGEVISSPLDPRYAESVYAMPSTDDIRWRVSQDPVFGKDKDWVEKTVNTVQQRLKEDQAAYVQRHAEVVDKCLQAIEKGEKPDQSYLAQLTVKEQRELEVYRKKLVAEDETGNREYAAYLNANPDVLRKMTKPQIMNAVRLCPKGTRQGILRQWEKEQKKDRKLAENKAAVQLDKPVFSKTSVTVPFVRSALSKLDGDYKKMDSFEQTLIAQEVASLAAEDAAFELNTTDQTAAEQYFEDYYKKSFVTKRKWLSWGRNQKSILAIKKGDLPSEVADVGAIMAKKFYNRKEVSDGQVASAVIRMLFRRSWGTGGVDLSDVLTPARRSAVAEAVRTELRQKGKTDAEIKKGVEMAMANDKVVLAQWLRMQINGEW